jgi:PhnB protein
MIFMRSLSTYLFFDGNAREAMAFYKECFGGELMMMTYGEGNSQCPEADKNKIMHANIKKNQWYLWHLISCQLLRS